jgi:hypothetical protein
MAATGDEVERLRASRRIDWRFLLPEPRLRMVAYAGGPDATMRHPLELFADGIVPIAGDGRAFGDAPPCDLIVLEGIAPEAWDRVLRGARGDWIYVELPRVALRERRRQLRRAVDGLARAGFSDVVPHWHWPTFGRCEEIVPLHSPGAVRLMLMRRRAYGDATKAFVARWLARANRLADVAPDVSLIARHG